LAVVSISAVDYPAISRYLGNGRPALARLRPKGHAVETASGFSSLHTSRPPGNTLALVWSRTI